MQWEADILLWIQNHMRRDILTPFMKFVTSIGDGGALWLLLVVVAILYAKYRKVGVMMLFSLLSSSMIANVIIKPLVARTRPYEMIETLDLLIAKSTSYSFPSGHTTASFAVAVVMLLHLPKRYGIPALFLAFLVGFTRMYVGIHYPLDVIGGAVLGSVMACLAGPLVNAFFKKVHVFDRFFKKSK